MSDLRGEIAENCGFEGKILCEVPQSCAPREKSDILPGSKWKCRTYGFTVTVIGLRPDREISYLADDGKTYSSPRHVWREVYEPWPQPEPETTSKQLAEIEAQAESTPATGYTPPEGWRVLAVGEVLRPSDVWVNHEGESRPTKRVGERVNDERYIRPIEPQPQPQPQPEPEPEPQPEPVPEPEPQAADTAATEYTPPDGYRVLQIGEVVQKDDIFLAVNGEHWPAKRIGETVNNNRYIRRIEVSQPCAPCDSRDNQAEYTLPEGCRNDGGWSSGGGTEPEPWPEPQPVLGDSQAETIGRLQAAIDERAGLGGADQTRAELQARIRGLEIMTDTQAETIARLQSEAHELNMEIGGLQGDLSRRQARIRDLETMHAAATQAVVDAGKENDKLRAQADDFRSEIHYVQKELGEARAELAGAIQSRDALQARICVSEIRRNETLREQLDAAATELQKLHPNHVGRAISTDEWMDQFARDASVSRLQADRNDLAGKVVSLREQLQLANDKLAQLEVLQPIAAACHTAQTMVRDMLGHMRCLLALQHTTDRRNFCTLLESILEVFDDAECDEDEDDDTTCTTNTSEAGQG